jgi:hypothetical protein
MAEQIARCPYCILDNQGRLMLQRSAEVPHIRRESSHRLDLD